MQRRMINGTVSVMVNYKLLHHVILYSAEASRGAAWKHKAVRAYGKSDFL